MLDVWCVCTQPLDLTLPASSRMVSLDQLVSETEGYHQLINKQVQDLSTAMGSSEEAEQLRETSKNMLEALRQCILVIKDAQLSERSDNGPYAGAETTPSPPPEAVPPSTVKKQKQNGGREGEEDLGEGVESEVTGAGAIVSNEARYASALLVLLLQLLTCLYCCCCCYYCCCYCCCCLLLIQSLAEIIRF